MKTKLRKKKLQMKQLNDSIIIFLDFFKNNSSKSYNNCFFHYFFHPKKTVKTLSILQ